MSDQPPQTEVRPYQVLARKYRPQSFADLIGQQAMVQTLSNAFATHRIAQAYMLSGVRGVGKTTTARILARALNYKSDTVDAPTIDLQELGEHCQSIMDGNHLDVIEMDAASHTGIDDIRDLIESAQYKPVSARYKVYIIDEVHMLSRNAFNGLLKTLEEPPAHLKFVFATTEIRKVPITILSRCQRFDLQRIDAEPMMNHLKMIAQKEHIQIEEEAARLIAIASEGSVRDGLSLLDQAIAHAGENISAQLVQQMLGLADRGQVMDLFEAIMRGDTALALQILAQQYKNGAEPVSILGDLAEFTHAVTRLKFVPNGALDKGPEEQAKAKQFAQSLGVRVLSRTWQILLAGIEEVSSSERPLMAAEMVLVRITHAADLPTPDELVRELQGKNQPSKSQGSIPTNSTAPAGTSESGYPVGNGAGGDLKGELPSSLANRLDDRAPGGEAISGSQPPAFTTLPPLKTDQTVLKLDRFEEVIFLAEDKRDPQLKACLRRNVRLVSFADGRMEINLAGNPPPNFVQTLSSRLKEWTGRHWIIATSKEGGRPSIEEQENANRQQQLDRAEQDPDVAVILACFEGSRVVDVRKIDTDEQPQSVQDPLSTMNDDFDQVKRF